jgi:hypothetical protein
VAVSVVERFEVVDVDGEDAHRLAESICTMKLVLEADAE